MAKQVFTGGALNVTNLLTGLTGTALTKALAKIAAFEAKVEAGKSASIKIGTDTFQFKKASGVQAVTFTNNGTAFTTAAALTTAATAPAPTPTPAPTPAPGQTFTLTTGNDLSGVLTGSAGTTSTDGADTFVATQATLGANDILVGGSGNDTLTIAATSNTTAPSVVVGIETINFNATSFTDLTFAAAGIVVNGSKVNLSNLQAGGATGVSITGLGTGANVAADSSISGTLSVTTAGATSESLTLAANTATTQTIVITGTGGTDTSAISAAGTVGYTAAATETQSFSGNGAAVTYNLGSALGATTNSITGSQSVTLAGTAARFAGATLTDSSTAGTSTVKIVTTSASTDLSKVAADLVELGVATNGHTYTVRPTQAVKISTATGGTVTFAVNDQTSTNITNGSMSIDLAVASVGNITLDNSGNDDFSTLTVTNNTADQTSTLTATTAVDVTVTGTKALDLGASSTAKSLNASALSGKLTVTTSANLKSLTGGSAGDAITAAAAVAATIDGGAGTDTVTVGAGGGGDIDATGLSLSNVEVLSLTDAAGTATDGTDFKASQLSGKTFVVTGAADSTIEIDSTGSVDATTIDLSKLTLNTANVTLASILVSAGTIANTIALGNAFTITGSSTADAVTLTTSAGANSVSTGAGADSVIGGTGADTISGGDAGDSVAGGDGADSITGGEGTDAIASGKGADIIVLTETTAVADTIVFGNETTVTGGTDIAFGALGGADTISGFTAGAGGDVLTFDISAFGLAGGTEFVGAVGSVAVNSSEEILVLTGAGYATDEAVEDALAARVTTDGLDAVIVYFNTTTNTARVIHDTDAGVDGTGTTTLVGVISNITTQAGFDLLTAANVDSFA